VGGPRHREQEGERTSRTVGRHPDIVPDPRRYIRAMADMNQEIIAEFRANDGVVGGYFEGKPVLLLHHTGAKSGTERVNPLMYNTDGDKIVIFASMGGAPKNPDWYHNLKANPDAEIEIGTDRYPVRATEVEGDERDRLWEKQKAEWDQFAGYEAATTRTIPVITLTRR
jgi:deazaflavin-dependent oxidoreductase (nitroreductase family)